MDGEGYPANLPQRRCDFCALNHTTVRQIRVHRSNLPQVRCSERLAPTQDAYGRRRTAPANFKAGGNGSVTALCSVSILSPTVKAVDLQMRASRGT